jgi:hypothetical protein
VFLGAFGFMPLKLTGGLPAPSSWIGGVLVSALRRRRLQKQGEDDQIPAQKWAHRATPETEMLFFNTQQSTSGPSIPSALLLNSRQRLKEAAGLGGGSEDRRVRKRGRMREPLGLLRYSRLN